MNGRKGWIGWWMDVWLYGWMVDREGRIIIITIIIIIIMLGASLELNSTTGRL